jgi:hypothetical protein
MRRKALLLLVTGALIAGMSAHAHHSFTATYDEGRTVRIEGTLVQFLFRNPHSWVHVMAQDDDGEMQRWGVEWGGLGVLAGQGVTRESLRPGDHVIITGSPGRNQQENRLLMRSLYRPADGFGWGFEGETFD